MYNQPFTCPACHLPLWVVKFEDHTYCRICGIQFELAVREYHFVVETNSSFYHYETSEEVVGKNPFAEGALSLDHVPSYLENYDTYVKDFEEKQKAKIVAIHLQREIEGLQAELRRIPRRPIDNEERTKAWDKTFKMHFDELNDKISIKLRELNDKLYLITTLRLY